MKTYLDDFITTLSTQRQERVGKLLNEATVAKDQLDVLANRLMNLQTAAPLLLRREAHMGMIQSNSFIQNLQTLWQRLQDIYGVSNSVALLLDSHSAILGSQVKSLDDQLRVIEKMSQNYAFLLADGGAYNFAYLEPFNDEKGREVGFTFDIPDRANQTFGPAENAVIRNDEGVLALIDNIDNPSSLVARIIKGNSTASIVSSTDINNVLTANSATGWRIVINSPSPITSSLPEANGVNGAQVLVEFQLVSPATANQIVIIPFADMAMDILNVTIFSNDDDSSGVGILKEPTPLNRPITLHFPMQAVVRFRLLLNQGVYNRLGISIHPGETQYQTLLTTVLKRQKTTRHYGRRKHILHTLRMIEILRVLNNKHHVDKRKALIGIPQIDFDTVWGPLRFDKLLLRERLQRNYNDWTLGDNLYDTILRLFKNNNLLFDNISSKIFEKFEDVFSEVEEKTKNFFDPFQNDIKSLVEIGPSFNAVVAPARLVTSPPLRRNYILPRSQDNSVVIVTPTLTTVQDPNFQPIYQYQYNLGLQYVSIGAQVLGFKGVFVSKVMPANDDIGQVRIKTSETNYRDPSTTRDSDLFTSVEYSVSNVSEPLVESDWIPIVPIDQNTVLIEGERFFPDNAGRGFFRFPASLSSNIVVYKNGFRIKELIVPDAYIYDNLKQSIVGIGLPNGTFSSQDFFTVDYYPASDYSVIDFDSITDATPNVDLPLVSAHDDTGAGEAFAGTGDRNTLDLLHVPYIDYDAVSTSVYSDTLGLNPYQPITIILQDGSTAINLTNYLPGGQALLTSGDGVTYVQKGTTIIFNQQIAQPFRVYYQYLQNNVRVRTVLRVNDKQFVSPTVDYFHLKAKAHLADPRGDFSS